MGSGVPNGLEKTASVLRGNQDAAVTGVVDREAIQRQRWRRPQSPGGLYGFYRCEGNQLSKWPTTDQETFAIDGVISREIDP